MRLQVVEHRLGLKQRLILALVRWRLGTAPDIMATLFHRPEFLGRPLGAITRRAMRLPSAWSVGERELFAAFVSIQNSCAFCVACHTEYACQAGDRQAVERTLRDRSAGDPRLDAALEFLAAFAAGAEAIERHHVDRLHAAGVSDAGIRDLAQIGFSFCLINRVADALDFKVLTPEEFSRSWPAMRDRGYQV